MTVLTAVAALSTTYPWDNLGKATIVLCNLEIPRLRGTSLFITV